MNTCLENNQLAARKMPCPTGYSPNGKMHSLHANDLIHDLWELLKFNEDNLNGVRISTCSLAQNSQTTLMRLPQQDTKSKWACKIRRERTRRSIKPGGINLSFKRSRPSRYQYLSSTSKPSNEQNRNDRAVGTPQISRGRDWARGRGFSD